MDIANFLDLQTLFVNEIAGSWTIFLFLALMVIMFLAAKYRFPNIVTINIFIVFLALISTANKLFLVIPLLWIVVFFTWFIIKIAKS